MRIILNWIFKKWDRQHRLMWLKTGAGGGVPVNSGMKVRVRYGAGN